MPRGPLPDPSARRTHKPTIAYNTLPAEGRAAPVPEVPERYALGDAGRDWWGWAWRLPQADKWDVGALHFVARRAELEDHAAALQIVDDIDLLDVINTSDDPDALRVKIKNLEWAISKLKSSATGSVALMKEMREIDNRLGLNPKAMADLRWSIADAPAETDDHPDVANLDEYRDRVG